MKVLVIEDSPEDRALYRRYLTNDGGFDVVDTETLRDAKLQFRTFTPDCVLVDFNLPDADRFGVIEALRSDQMSFPCAFIIVTGEGSEHLAVTSFRSGADDYVAKNGLTPTLLQSSIQKAVGRVQARQERQRYLQALEYFASIAAHDLKAPLQTVKGYTELTKFGGNEISETTRGDYLDLVLESCSRMESLIDGLLAYAQSGEEAASLVLVDVGKTVEDVMKVLAGKIQDTGARIQVGDLGTVMGDALGIHQVFQNLIDNAMQYADKGAPQINLSSTQFGDWAIYSVSDNGPGVPDHERERVFMPLVRLGDREKRQGHGLGLAICQQIIERHGGRIWVNKETDGGATFCFSLPLKDDYSEFDD